jgi:hypothetical protein
VTSAALLNEARSREASDVVLQVEQLRVRFNVPELPAMLTVARLA